MQWSKISGPRILLGLALMEAILPTSRWASAWQEGSLPCFLPTRQQKKSPHIFPSITGKIPRWNIATQSPPKPCFKSLEPPLMSLSWTHDFGGKWPLPTWSLGSCRAREQQSHEWLGCLPDAAHDLAPLQRGGGHQTWVYHHKQQQQQHQQSRPSFHVSKHNEPTLSDAGCFHLVCVLKWSNWIELVGSQENTYNSEAISSEFFSVGSSRGIPQDNQAYRSQKNWSWPDLGHDLASLSLWRLGAKPLSCNENVQMSKSRVMFLWCVLLFRLWGIFVCLKTDSHHFHTKFGKLILPRFQSWPFGRDPKGGQGAPVDRKVFYRAVELEERFGVRGLFCKPEHGTLLEQPLLM